MSDKIIGGVESVQGRFPYAASLQDFDFAFCGGSLIGHNVVLTAGHCIEGGFEGTNTFGLNVVIGCVDLNDPVNCETFGVIETFLHPNYNPAIDERNDVALLHLDGSSSITPVRLAGIRPNNGDIATVIGWGLFDPYGYGGSFDYYGSDTLREVDLAITSSSSCQEANDNFAQFVGAFPFDIFPEMICAVGDFQDSCQGDSGGALLLACDGPQQDVVVGVVSFGFGCAVEGVPGVYANIAHPGVLSFIVTKSLELGVTVNIVSDLGNFCSIDVGNVVPTPFPTRNISDWICNIGFLGSFDGCDCNCGAVDPDCQLQQDYGDYIFGCPFGEVCIEGICSNDTLPTAPSNDPRTFAPFSPTLTPTSSPTIITLAPTDNPTISPTNSPSFIPTENPTSSPTFTTFSPTDKPTVSPVLLTSTPTKSPNNEEQSNQPTNSPVASPISEGNDDAEQLILLGVIIVFVVVVLLLIVIILLLKCGSKSSTSTDMTQAKPIYQTGGLLAS